jgi:hypothetical protein
VAGEESHRQGEAMPTFLWVLYDVILFAVGLWFLERNLTAKEKIGIGGLAIIGLVIGVYSGYSDHVESAKMDSLLASNSYTQGELDSVSKTLGSLAAKSGASTKDTVPTIAKSAVAKIDQLESEVASLRHETEPRHLTPEQAKSLAAAFHKKGTDISDRLWIVSYPECFECRSYGWEIAQAIDSLKPKHWVGVMQFPYIGVQLSTDWRGLIIGTKDASHLTDDQKRLVAILRAAHLPYSFEPIVFENSAVLLVAPQAG